MNKNLSKNGKDVSADGKIQKKILSQLKSFYMT
jgi:hypothetical protein